MCFSILLLIPKNCKIRTRQLHTTNFSGWKKVHKIGSSSTVEWKCFPLYFWQELHWKRLMFWQTISVVKYLWKLPIFQAVHIFLHFVKAGITSCSFKESFSQYKIHSDEISITSAKKTQAQLFAISIKLVRAKILHFRKAPKIVLTDRGIWRYTNYIL